MVTLYVEVVKMLSKGIVKCDVPWEMVPADISCDDPNVGPLVLKPNANITELAKEIERFVQDKMEDAWEDAVLTAHDLGYIYDLDKDDLLARSPYGHGKES